MKPIFLMAFVFLFTQSSAFAHQDCSDFTGTYALTGPCEETDYSGEGMVFPLEKSLGVISVGGSFKISQNACKSITLGTETKLPNGTLFQTKHTFADSVRHRSPGLVQIQFNASELPFSVFKGSVVIEKTDDGIVFKMKSTSWNAVFQQIPMKISNTCTLTKI